MATTRRVLSVGQCGFDHGGISRALHKAFGAEVVRADSAQEALQLLRADPFAVVLVNRVFDADGNSGLDLVRAIKSDERLHELPVMLVSNYEEAQQEAVAAGAAPGFGKNALGRPEMLARLEPYLAADR